MRLEAAGGLTVDVADDSTIRIGWGEPDWLGQGVLTVANTPSSGAPLRFAAREPATTVADDLGPAVEVATFGSDGDVRLSVRAYDQEPVVVLRVEACTDLALGGGERFDEPTVGYTFTPADRLPNGAPEGMRALAFQHCEFGLPSNAGADLDGFFLLPHRPPTGWPLLLTAPDGRTLLLAALDGFHDQTIGLNGGTVRCGWHGHLERVPAGFATDLAVIAAPDARAAIDRWGEILLRRAGTVRPGRWADALASRPSYWTDNGAAYWYRTEPGLDDVADSIVAAVDDLRAKGVRVGSVQLDSWFYPHTELRPFDTDEWVVPPTAMEAWEERPDVLPAGIAALRSRLGDPPLVAHIRHLSSTAAIASEVPVHVDGPYAAPATPEAYERWLDQCLAWGVETFEHDWLVEVFFGVGGLRQEPGRARAWQEGIDRAARERGITLQWCMGTPADLAQTTTLTQVTSVRTCGDHGYIATAGQLWAWFCATNALARALGLMPFKDVFRADPEVAGDHGEPEALLSALSTGPVGLGDRVGRFDPALALATCRADGILIKPDVPIAATGPTLLANTGFRNELLVAECFTDHPAGRWAYVFAAHPNPDDTLLERSFSFADLGESSPAGDVVAWDWRAGTATRLPADGTWDVALGLEEWAHLVLAPVLPGELAVIGDVSKFVPAGDARIEVSTAHPATGTDDGSEAAANTSSGATGAVRVVVKGAGETVTITGWAASTPTATVAGSPVPVGFDPTTGVWTVDVAVGWRGWATVDVTPT